MLFIQMPPILFSRWMWHLDPNVVELNNTNTKELINNILETEALGSKISALEAEDNCDSEKILAYKGCDEWKGHVHDHSLFNLFKEKSTELQKLKSQKQTNLNRKAHVVGKEPNHHPTLETTTKINENEITPDQFMVQPNQPTTSSYLVPSPFKRALVWPEHKGKKLSKRSKKQKVKSGKNTMKKNRWKN